MHNLTYSEAVAKAEHLIALEDTDVYLTDATDFPYDKVCHVVEGASHRLTGPASCRLIVQEHGLTFSLSVDFEKSDANGRSVNLFDRERLRALVLKLPVPAKRAFATMLVQRVLPGIAEHTVKVLDMYSKQVDSEECVRGLIDFCRASSLPASAKEGAA